ncbi:helix-turn-helix transcriptional regulator [Allokutzneria albata]|uniref:Predicted transcriptional regulator YheO, contains PAS and DNA-binding HTH domains n=1 Tax=Allokutzneria albata TaxID=211114 RepID=A0A1G9WTM4_ALLAB|nr:PAS domain-containing protein [Allokutzneria albata]SDM87515.1 Predicted transcriptional regulator YheO, contains PAS and DNA-binding HTH domains [Allokutzneria albata]
MDERVERYGPVCAAVAALLSPHAEVVLHDPAEDVVLAVWNPFSGRAAGDPSLLGELDEVEPGTDGVLGPYPKVLADGRALTSVTAILRDPDAVLCVNLDRGPFEQAAALLSAFAAPVALRPEPLFEHDWFDRVNQAVGSAVRLRGPVDRWGKSDRVAVLSELDSAGVFAVRRAAPEVARALKVSRSTVYALLAEVRGEKP